MVKFKTVVELHLLFSEGNIENSFMLGHHALVGLVIKSVVKCQTRRLEEILELIELHDMPRDTSPHGERSSRSLSLWPQTSLMHGTWECVRNARPQALPQNY